MPELYSARTILKVLRKAGFQKVSQRGSHVKLLMLKGGKKLTTIVPNHKIVASGTFGSILR